MKKIILFLVIAFACTKANAQSYLQMVGTGKTGTRTDNGVICTFFDTGVTKGLRADPFNSYSLGTSGTYIYNDAGSTTAAAGSLLVLDYSNREVFVNITSLQDAGTTTVGIFFAVGSTTPWYTYSETVYSGTQSGCIVLPLQETPEYMRVGVKRTGTSAATLTIKGLYKRFLWGNR